MIQIDQFEDETIQGAGGVDLVRIENAVREILLPSARTRIATGCWTHLNVWPRPTRSFLPACTRTRRTI